MQKKKALKAQVISNDDSLNCLSNMNKMQPFRGSYITFSQTLIYFPTVQAAFKMEPEFGIS